jgi:hypothetical protein
LTQPSLSRAVLRRSIPVALFAFAALAAPSALACADVGCEPDWTLDHPSFDGCNNAPFLSPGNDSRINLQLLVYDLQAGRARPAPDPASDKALFVYDEFVAAYAPPGQPAAPAADSDLASGEGSRCVSNRQGAEAFVAAVRAASGLSDAERAALVQARTDLSPTCLGGARTAVAGVDAAVKSAPARQFAAYLTGAAAFYDSDFDTAHQAFAGLAGARSPWLKEAAKYMLARVELNRAQVGAFGDYGELDRTKVGAPALAAAEAGFTAYLRDYPSGAYAASARGLMRRVYWLGGQPGKLAGEFGWQFIQVDTPRTNVTVADLAQEVDNKLGPSGDLASGAGAAQIDDPLLLATLDLVRMRRSGPPEAGQAPAAPDFGLDALLAQRRAFAANPALFDYLLAVHHLYLENDPAGALKLLPAEADGAPATNLGFSRRILRGRALEALGDKSARAYWLKQIDAARAPFQRPTVELALAMNYERGDALGQVFAPGSPIRNADLRDVLLRNDAPPTLLRARAAAADASDHERRLALFVLLYKDITRGREQAFLTDVALMPEDAVAGSDSYVQLGDVGLFAWSGTTGKPGAFACPSLGAVAGRLARAPGDPHTRLCLGEFVRLNGLDGFEIEQKSGPGALGGAPSKFPGAGLSRLEIYKQVMADPKAAADERAYALYRAVNCYGPSGYNGCGGVDVPLAQRKAWFKTLKTTYAASPWAADLKYFW